MNCGRNQGVECAIIAKLSLRGGTCPGAQVMTKTSVRWGSRPGCPVWKIWPDSVGKLPEFS